MSTRKSSRTTIGLCLILILVTLAACAPAATPQVVEKEVVVEKSVVQTVVVEKEVVVEKSVVQTVVVEKEVAVEKVVTAIPAPKVLRLAATARAFTWDVSTSTGGGYECLSNVFEGLTQMDLRTGEVVPAAAERWEASADGKQYTFYLRKGMTWTDGHPVTAQDFEYSWKRTLNPETGSRMAFMMYVIKGAQAYAKGEAGADAVGVKALDDYTLQISLERPAAYLPSMVSVLLYSPLPQWTIEEYGEKWNDPDNIVTNGPYMYESWKPDVEAVLVHNPDYWGPQTGVDKAIFVAFENKPVQGLVAYENDEVDLTTIGADDLERVRNDPVLSKELQVDLACSVTTLALDTTTPPTDDARVRRALSLGIDRLALANGIYKGARTPAYTLIPVGIDGRNPAAALEGGVPEAQRLLAEAGFPGGEGFPELQYVTGSDPDSKLMAEFLQNQWQTNLNIDLKLVFMESAAFGAWRTDIRNNRSPYGVVLRGYTADYLDAVNWFNDILDSSTDYWDTRWKNDEFDALVRAAAVESDPDKRRKMYQDAEVMAMQDSPAIPMVYSTYYTVIKPYVGGVYLPPDSMGRIIRLKYIDVYQ